MSIQLAHSFKDKLPSIDELFLVNNEHGVITTINSFCDRINILAPKYATLIDENIFKGDALELFTEYMIKANPTDNRIGITNYKLISETFDEDTGVDGLGTGANGNPATVQVKYRSGDYVLTANADHLSNFLTSSWGRYGVSITDKVNMLIVTTGLKVDEITREKMLQGKVRVLKREDLREMFDNNVEWWKSFYESVRDSRIQKETIKFPPITLRKHQSEAVDAVFLDENFKGKIFLPTGTGKTNVEAEIIYRTIINKQAKGENTIVKVNASRILLCFQLFEEMFKHLSSKGISNVKYVNFNSGSPDERFYISEMAKLNFLYREILSTTSPEEVKKEKEICDKENRNLIIFSTYHSSEKFALSGIIPNLTINDEAHNLVSPEFSNAATLPTFGNLFFTATEKTTDSDKDLGMNNPVIFDNVIYSRSAKELIADGEMVSPRLHKVLSRNKEMLDTDFEMMFHSITDAFQQHEKKIKAMSFAPETIGGKVLVVCRGQEDLIEMFKTKALTQFKIDHPEIHLYGLSSEFGIYNDGEMITAPVNHIKKFKFIRDIKALKSEEKCIIFHVDMLGEGIDVPGITGVMPFRNCELSKFVQNVGRSTRLHPLDRKRFYNNEITPSKTMGAYIKGFAWIIVPTFLQHSEGFAGRFKDILSTLKNVYGYIPTEVTITNNDNGLGQDPDIDTINKKTKNRPHEKSKIKDFIHEYDDLDPIDAIIVENEIEEAKAKLLQSLIDHDEEIGISHNEDVLCDNGEVKTKHETVSQETTNQETTNQETVACEVLPVALSVALIKEETTPAITSPDSVQDMSAEHPLIAPVVPSEPAVPYVPLTLYCKTKKANATGILNQDGSITVLKDSLVAKEDSLSIQKTYEDDRYEKCVDGTLIPSSDDKYFILTKDVTYKKLGPAASMICGLGVSGGVYWKDVNGTSFQDIKKNH